MNLEQGPNTDEIKTIAQAALTAPSGDNCQPFVLEWKQGCLRVSHVEARGQHALNRLNHTSMITLGSLIELVRIAARAQGYQAHVDYSSTLEKDGVWAKVQFGPCEKTFEPLAKTINLRATDRRLYHGGSLEDDVFAQLNNEFDPKSPVQLHVAKPDSEKLVEYLTTADEFVWDHARAMRDLLGWMRFNKKQTIVTRDGLPWQNLGVNFIESRMLKALKANPRWIHVLKALGFKRQIRTVSRKQIKSSTALICFSTRSLDKKNLILLGEKSLRCWLHLNAHGYGVQPLTIGSLSVFDQMSQALPADTLPQFRELFQQGQGILSEHFHLQSEIPVWLFRVGKSSPLPQQMRTQRRSLREFLKT